MKNIITLIISFLVFSFGYGQTKLAEITFESTGGYSTTITEFTDGTGDYFIRTDGSNTTNEVFVNIQGAYYFAAQDIDGDGAIIPATFLLNNVNISGYSNIELRVYLAEDDDGAVVNQDWDNPDYVHFNYDIDNTGTFTNLLWIENDGSAFNSAPFIDTDYDGIGDGTEITNTFTQFTQNVTGTGDLLDVEIIFNLNAGDEDIAIDNIEIWGTLIPCGAAVTWDGATWDNAGVGPDINTSAILNGNYNTTTNGSFSACSLTVDVASKLTIANSTYVEVQNDITVDGEIFVDDEGALVQNNDSSTVTVNAGGQTSVDKVTSTLNVYYEYTYWSSPVSPIDINGGLTEAEVSRRFLFDGSKFLDATAEAGNNNATLAGQDDIDDNGDDWTLVDGLDLMTPGVGYASTHDEFIYNISPGKTFRYSFVGDFNNGAITVPIYRNDEELNDNNWNFIGNPYPSAISADLFLAANSGINANVVTSGPIDGAIFLWSQNTAPTSTTNGNEVLNFSASDYAIINGTAQSAGGDNVLPSRFIPSGQGFFVSMSNTAPASFFSVGDPVVTGDIVTTNIFFNNSMRVTGNNDQFFRVNNNSKSKSIANKIWFNLTSDNGVFNQAVVGYVNGATNNYDGTYYDAPRNLSTGAASIIYTTIEGSNKYFAIQGKAENSLNEDEVINLGFKTTIDVATIYTLSIAQLEGDFLNGNPIYLKDNLLNTLHNLKDGDYNFTSTVGEFNERFEIVFNQEALSLGDQEITANNLSIIDLQNGTVQFKFSGNITMSSVQIIDLQGRILYNLKADSNSITYNLSNLSLAPYIAKVTLSNGTIITKKAIKSY